MAHGGKLAPPSKYTDAQEQQVFDIKHEAAK